MMTRLSRIRKILPRPIRWSWVIVVLVVIGGLFAANPLYVRYRIYQSQLLLQERDYPAALKLLTGVVGSAPNNGEARFWLARAYRRSGQTNDVLPLLEQSRKLGFSAERLDREWWLTVAQSGRIEEAEPYLPELLRDPRDDGKEICEAFFHGFRANLRFAEANLLLDVWQADFPKDPEPHFLRGLGAEMIGRSQLAVDEYRHGLKLAPDRPDFQHRLAQALLKQNEPQAAEDHFRRCLSITPDNLDAIVGLGTCHIARGKYEDAAACFHRVLDRQPRHFDARLGLGKLCHLRGDPAEAVRWLQPLVEKWPGDTQAQYALAQALQAAGQPELARRHLQAYQESLRKLDRLEKLFEEIAETPNDVQKRFEIGASLLTHHSRQNGEAWLKSVLQLNPTHREAHRALADYYAKQGRDDLANQHRRMAKEE